MSLKNIKGVGHKKKVSSTLKKEQVILKQFLKERKLTTPFKRFKKFKSVKKRSLVISQELDDRTIKRTKIFILKEKNRTVVRRAADFEILATTKKNIPTTLNGITETVKKERNIQIDFDKKVRTDEGFETKKINRGWKVRLSQLVNKIKLKSERKETNYNKKSGFLNTIVTRNFALRKKGGSIVVDAVVVCSSGRPNRVTARSRIFENLSNSKIKDIALQDAIDNASSVAECSPLSIIVNNFWFEYRFSKYAPREKVTRF